MQKRFLMSSFTAIGILDRQQKLRVKHEVNELSSIIARVEPDGSII